jgi:tetratricopeptide (TPR) repeat protein
MKELPRSRRLPELRIPAGAGRRLPHSVDCQHAMRFHNWRKYFLSLVVALCLLPGVVAQTGADAYSAKRQEAEDLFRQGKRLEALPLLEELVKTNPKDDTMLVALAACLVDHAATISDQESAGKERLRARDLLDKAWNMGNTSTLAMNLSQLLKQLPESGAIKFSDDPQVEQAMRAGESAFSQRDFDEARKDYSNALELEPNNYSAVLFTANTYDKQNAWAKGAEWYERAIELDPNVETAYRYYADMLAKQGDMAKARIMLIHAAVAEPYNGIVWRELHAWATLNHTRINEIYISVPTEGKDKQAPRSPDISRVWRTYREVRTNWQKGGQFKKQFPEEKEYRHSLPEEFEALTAAARVLKQIEADNEVTELVTDDQSFRLLMTLYQAGLIEPYVLFSLGDTGIARDYDSYRAKSRRKLEEYMDKFVVPPAR